ncbi:MAG: transglutaminase domain-containing protein [Candidatus Marinimicrobia bacterium]|jgi:transglutaminase-like putative cysteine protease|nr:transglutaminase domain-containing protein [Candidatus Neomarinimicrobiota bacterium]MBT3676353.1 transglutaminase domain-containing protein [Candidatus Neomarinimicrobiota bacterium]MBT3763079.1 transglutaminase domain-containing protein [Candidatus Neomarinimicrobiota bacterium]MBT4067097.1 transglutaminase domain-containing protein [Candidatus Neomarinimicrobiota bacterium]MBT4270456.1 transglutaminase domain-containing protein [Candidatus Neomarinimicrobiota bacterium]
MAASTLSELSITGMAHPNGLDVNACLVADDWIDHDHPEIVKKVEELTEGLETDWEKVRAIFDFTRDEIVYNFAPIIESDNDFKASSVLAGKNGMCHQKSNLQAALFRAAGIPAALTYQKIVDHPLMNTRYKEMIPDGVLPYHALAAIHVDGEWYRMEATLDSGLCERRGYRKTELVDEEESLLPTTKENGDLHFDIIEDHGYFDSYPQEFLTSMLANKENWKIWRSFVRKEHLSM